MGDENENIGCVPENGAALGKISKAEEYQMICAERRKHFLRDNPRIIHELSYERRELCDKIGNLKNAIIANPEKVSFEHKKLWRLQYEAMLAYKDALDKRIVNLIKESENDYNIDDKTYNI